MSLDTEARGEAQDACRKVQEWFKEQLHGDIILVHISEPVAKAGTTIDIYWQGGANNGQQFAFAAEDVQKMILPQIAGVPCVMNCGDRQTNLLYPPQPKVESLEARIKQHLAEIEEQKEKFGTAIA